MKYLSKYWVTVASKLGIDPTLKERRNELKIISFFGLVSRNRNKTRNKDARYEVKE